MRFTRQALLLLLTGSASCASAFVAPIHNSALVHVPISSPLPSLDVIKNNRRFSRLRRSLAASDDDDDDDDDDEYGNDPLAKGVDSVSWLPSVTGARPGADPLDMKKESSSSDDKTEILPLFPLGGIVYTPNSEHVLNIFEPRYRQMYTDILMNGTKRFVVSMSHPAKQGVFAATGVLFELQDLKEVSEQTADQIKYICNHKVTGRVHLQRILNPSAWETRDTYLRVEGSIVDDSGRTTGAVGDGQEKGTSTTATDNVYGVIASAVMGDNNNPAEESKLQTAFGRLVELQHELEEDVRFTRASVGSLAVKNGAGQDGLWQTIRLWQSFADQRLLVMQNELQADFQTKLLEFLKKERGLKEEDIPSAIGFDDLSPSLQQEVNALRKRMAVELQPLLLESTLTMQKILEAANHTARLRLVRHFVQAETRRLQTKKALKGMGTSSSSKVPPEEQIDTDDEPKARKPDPKTSSSGTAASSGDSATSSSTSTPPPPPSSSSSDNNLPSSIFPDEPDAFQ